jgi:hypothetical protein
MACEATGEVGFGKKINPGSALMMNGNFGCDDAENEFPWDQWENLDSDRAETA